MQPKYKLKKTLLASALLAGLSNAYIASADTFTVSAGTIADVSVTPSTATGTGIGTELSFGSGVKIQPAAGDTCSISAALTADDEAIGIETDGTTAAVAILAGNSGAGITAGQSYGQGCLTTQGSFMLFDIDGVDSSTVQVSIPDVVGTGWTYSAGSETCVMDYNGGTTADSCSQFTGTSLVTGVNMADATDSNELPATTDTVGYTPGATTLILGGTLTFDGTALTAPAGDVVTVTVTYE